METIMMSGKEYLLYLRARQELMENYILDCFKNAKDYRLSEQEIYSMVGEKFRCELPVDDAENVILKGVVMNLLDRYEVWGYITPMPTKYGPGYQLIDKKTDEAA